MLFLLANFLLLPYANAQGAKKVRIHGTVYKMEAGKRVPLDFASVQLVDYGMGAVTDESGNYTINEVPTGRTHMRIQYLGAVTIDTLLNIKGTMHMDFTMQNEDFNIKEIVVVAQSSQAGKSTASKVSRTAIDHMQANNLFDLLSMIPGGVIDDDPGMHKARTLNMRDASNSAMNSLGTAIIRDGAPISNNANLTALAPSLSGKTSAAVMDGGGPATGADVRSISTENIESIEFIRGIPSVEYGDLTSGAVIINAKAGREPLRVNARVNPYTYAVSAGSGFDLGGKKGALNISGDYAYNVTEPTSTYVHYQRFTAKALYSNTFGRLRSNTSLDVVYSKDTRERNPDDEIDQKRSGGKELGFTVNTNGRWDINKGWLKNIRYVLSGTYTNKNNFHEELYTSGNANFSMTTVDGAILSNKAGQDIYDIDGNKITNLTGVDPTHYANYLPNSYKGRYDLNSKEINLFAKLTANFFKKWGNTNNRILLGVDFRADGNEGDGKMFDPATPPYREVGYANSSFRERSYKDIPYVKQFGAFVEENFNWMIGERNLNIQLGARYDNASVVGGILSPRVNASFDIIPEKLTIRGGYGITAKMPTLLYLYPEDVYFEYDYINELTSSSVPEDERLFITNVKRYNTENKDLKIAKNHKAELGFDLNLGKVSLGVTAFTERLKNGYVFSSTIDTYEPYTWNIYKRDKDANALYLDGTYNVLSKYSTPTNNRFTNTKGVEFDLNVGRIDAIRTSFQVNGAWMRTESYSNGHSFYDENDGQGYERADIAIYDRKSSLNYSQRFTTTLRATHNIPSIGFVVTLTAQAIWDESDWTNYRNDTIPVGYISTQDGSVNWFKDGQFKDRQDVIDAGYRSLLDNVEHSNAIKESYGPYYCFNINVTKQIGKNIRASFFANNMFRSYPRIESTRTPGNYKIKNNRYYFGLELSLTL
ncbi:MAG: TonB-dependent receptor plug domain-containing protein [Bacteroides sp.]|nr:TonB-dependent receptor plug domain-containing protein [Bacteroides sp.]